MTAPADLAEVRAALALVAQATPGPWATDPDGDLVGADRSVGAGWTVRYPNGTTRKLVGCLFAERNISILASTIDCVP